MIGAAGQVGRQLTEALVARGDHRLPLPASRAAREGWLSLDLAELSGVQQAASLLDHIPLEAIYCVGGMTHVEGCEAASDLAYRINTRGPGILASYASRRSLPFVYFSTEYVFPGDAENSGPYSEESEPRPINAYGESKLDGERAVLDAHAQALVLRTTVVYGQDEQQKNFVYSLLRNLRDRNPMLIPEDQISTPTYNRDLARATVGLVDAHASGIYHVCGPELLGRLQFALQIADLFGLDTSLLKGMSTAELGQVAVRPLNAGLCTDKLRREYPELVMRTVADSIADCRPVLERFLTHSLIDPML